MRQVISILLAATAFTAAFAGIEANASEASDAPLTLPFREGFDTSVDGTPSYDNPWKFSTTSTSRYPRKWNTASGTYVGTTRVEPVDGQGGLAYIGYYSNPTEITRDAMTSAKIDVDGVAMIECGYNFYGCGDGTNSEVGLEVIFDDGEPVGIHHASMTEAAAGWQSAESSVAVPAGAQTVQLRYYGINNSNPSTVIVDNIWMRTSEAPKIIFPASVGNLTGSYDKSSRTVSLTFTAPALSHPVLGDIHGEALQAISATEIRRSIAGGEFVSVKTFEAPQPGAELSFLDQDITTGGEFVYDVRSHIDGNYDGGAQLTLSVGQKPLAVTDFTAVSTRGLPPVTLHFTTPSVDSDGDQLTDPITLSIDRRIHLSEDSERIADHVEATAESQMTYTDTQAQADMAYIYTITIHGLGGDSPAASAEVFVGIDAPDYPSDIFAVADANGRVTLTWTAPAKSLNGGFADLDDLSYDIFYGNPYDDYLATQVATGVKECTFTDPRIYLEETVVRYYVRAVAGGIPGYGGRSNFVTVGSPVKLPFYEGFDSQENQSIFPSHTTWSRFSSEENSTWAFAEMAYYLMEGQILPYNSSVGLAYCYYSPFNAEERDDYLTTGRLDFSGTTAPTLSFMLYAVPGYDNSLDVELSTDGAASFATVATFKYDDYAEAGWQRIEVPLTDGIDKICAVRFHSHKGTHSSSIAIDDVRIDTPSGIAAIESNGITVRAVAGGVGVTGNDGNRLPVYNTAGITVAVIEGNGTTLLAPGFYIINGAKVAVK